MDLRQLRHFVSVAEQMNFGRAADVLGVAQPYLSRSIGKLERSIGVALFDRSRRQIALTPAGEVLFFEASEILSRLALARRLVQRASNREQGQLIVGCSSPSLLLGVTAPAIAAFRKVRPEIEILIKEVSAPTMIESLLDGRIDLTMSLKYDVADPRISTRPLYMSTICAMMPESFPLADREEIRFAELQSMPFILEMRGVRPYYDEMVTAAFREAGFSPQVVTFAEAHTIAAFVSAGIGVTLANSISSYTSLVAGVRYVKIIDAPECLRLDFVLGWMPKATGKPLAAFMDMAVETAAALKAPDKWSLSRPS
jgi:DNA-binding transcriptional LysR family regulator